MADCRTHGRREAPIRALRIVIAICLGLLASVASAAAPRVVSVDLDGAPLPGASATLDTLLGREASPVELARLLRALEDIDGSGSFDVELAEQRGRATVRVHHLKRTRRVGEIAVQVDGEDLGAERSRALLRRVAVRNRIFLAGGRRHHPYLLEVDRLALMRFYVARGYRDVEVTAVVLQRPGLVDVGWQVRRGARYVYTQPGFAGAPSALRGAIGRGLRVRSGAPAVQTDRAADARRIEAALCSAGYPRAEVTTDEHVGPVDAEGDRPVTVDFRVDAGPQIRTGAVQVVGRYVPQLVVATLPLQERGPYCPDLEEAARVRLVEFLRDAGVPDPTITAHRRTWLRPDGRRVIAVTFDVRRLVSARIERIWYVGNVVTTPEVLRQLTAITEGARYRQSLVDDSVQAMRRSGLFRRVAVDIVEGARPDRVSLRFRVEERPPFRVDPVGRSVTLYNLDLTAWPEDSTDLTQGFAFRGAGQRLDLYGKTESLGFRWFQAFLGRYLIGAAGFRYNTASTLAFDETWISGDVGLGLKTATNDISGLLSAQLVWHDSARAAGQTVPVLDGTSLTGAAAFQLSLDFTRRDDERIQYLGIEAQATVRAGTAFAGEPLSWFDDNVRFKLHVPVWRTQRGQHWVLRLGLRNRAVIPLGDSVLPGNLRQRPSARGYASKAFGVVVTGPNDASERIGALQAMDASLELRVPLPYGRRNGVIPFLDAATAADTLAGLPDEVRYAAGLALTFSLFSERVEGVVWAAWPLDADAEAEFVGGGFGGGF